MSSLNLNDYQSPQQQSLPEGEKLQLSKKVQNIGTISLIISIISLCVPFLGVASFFLARHGLSISRQHLIDPDYEKMARWAHLISLFTMLGSVFVLVRLVLM